MSTKLIAGLRQELGRIRSVGLLKTTYSATRKSEGTKSEVKSKLGLDFGVEKRCSAVLGSQCGLGGSPHEQLAWFPPLAIASRQCQTSECVVLYCCSKLLATILKPLVTKAAVMLI
uniref:Uncharacterized protein n=1 Tax=Moorena producens (strain JHB) TaxID=1454205 RepID=A0A1D9FUK4_MOOP1